MSEDTKQEEGSGFGSSALLSADLGVASRSWDMMARHVCTVAEKMIETHFGERCPSSEPDCPICEKWHLLDKLVASPYDND